MIIILSLILRLISVGNSLVEGVLQTDDSDEYANDVEVVHISNTPYRYLSRKFSPHL